MQKVYGSPVRQDGLYKIGRNKWELIYGFGKDHEDDETGWNYRKTFDHLPTLQEIKDTIIGQINADTDEKILCGFEWQGMKVWLSSENQFNYKAAYDLAVQTAGASLPVKFKFGTDEQPQYKNFTTVEELSDFFTKALKHVNNTLEAGWNEKDIIDWSKFDLPGCI